MEADVSAYVTEADGSLRQIASTKSLEWQDLMGRAIMAEKDALVEPG